MTTIVEHTWTANDAKIFPSEVCLPCGKLFEVGDQIVEAFDSNGSRLVHSECFKTPKEVPDV